MTHSKKDQLNIRPLTKHAGYPKRGWLLVLVLLITLIGMPGLGASPVFALPPEPIDPDPVGGSEPVTPPENGFDWSVPARFGPYANCIVDYHWIADRSNHY